MTRHTLDGSHARAYLGVMRREFLMLTLAAALLGGCIFKGGPAAPGAGAAEPWPFVPVAMRVHPFTTLVNDPQREAPVLEAHIEMLDQLGDVTKGVGHFRFELYQEQEKNIRTDETLRLYMWDAPLLTIEQNQNHFDSSTRTYVFKLKLEKPLVAGQNLKISAQMTAPGGKRLIATAPLTYSGATRDSGRPTGGVSK